MLGYITIFLVALLTGSQSERPAFRPLACLLSGLFLSLCLLWQATHDWPGVINNSAFAVFFGNMLLLAVAGVSAGSLILKRLFTKTTKQ